MDRLETVGGTRCRAELDGHNSLEFRRVEAPRLPSLSRSTSANTLK